MKKETGTYVLAVLAILISSINSFVLYTIVLEDRNKKEYPIVIHPRVIPETGSTADDSSYKGTE